MMMMPSLWLAVFSHWGFFLHGGLCLFAHPVVTALNGDELYFLPDADWQAVEIITQGDSTTADWSMPPIFDGLGAYIEDDDKLYFLVNHETAEATISQVQVDRTMLEARLAAMAAGSADTSDPFVLSAARAYDQVSADGGLTWEDAATAQFARFCSSQVYLPGAFGSPLRGFVDTIYLTGEEVPLGRMVALDPVQKELYILSGTTGGAKDDSDVNPGMPFDSWENAALLDTGENDHVALVLSPDGGTTELKLYVGTKGLGANGEVDETSFLARNGLAYGAWYVLQGQLPVSVGSSSEGRFGTTREGALASTKFEDVDTNPNQPTQMILGDQTDGVFLFDFDLTFSNSGKFDMAASSFSVSQMVGDTFSIQTFLTGATGKLDGADNVDWTMATEVDGMSFPSGLIFLNEDNALGEVWELDPENVSRDPVRIGHSALLVESSGVLDISSLLGYQPGHVLATSTQGFPSSLTVLLRSKGSPAHPDIATSSLWFFRFGRRCKWWNAICFLQQVPRVLSSTFLVLL